MSMHFDLPTFFLACGALYMAMPMMVWVLLQRRHRALHVNLWCASGLLFSVTLSLYGLRGQIDDLLSVHLANLCAYVALSLQVCVLMLLVCRLTTTMTSYYLPEQWPVLVWCGLLAVRPVAPAVQAETPAPAPPAGRRPAAYRAARSVR